MTSFVWALCAPRPTRVSPHPRPRGRERASDRRWAVCNVDAAVPPARQAIKAAITRRPAELPPIDVHLPPLGSLAAYSLSLYVFTAVG